MKDNMHRNAQNALRGAIQAILGQDNGPADHQVGFQLGAALIGLCNLGRGATVSGADKSFTIEDLIEASLLLSGRETLECPLDYQCDKLTTFLGDYTAHALGLSMVYRIFCGDAQKIPVDKIIINLCKEDLCFILKMTINGTGQDDGDPVQGFMNGFLQSLNIGIEKKDASFQIHMPIACIEHGELLQGKTVLLVDDDQELRRIYRKMIESLAGTVVEAEHGQKAIEQYEQSDFDLILMDIDMPVLDGCKAIQGIMDIKNKSNRSEPIIISLTALADNQTREESVRLGAAMCLMKPFEIEVMKQIIRRYVLGVPGDITYFDDGAHEVVYFDESQLRETYELMGEDDEAVDVIKSLLDDFRNLGPTSAREISEIASDGESEAAQSQITRVSHTLKSRASAIGLKRLAVYAAEVERLSAKNEFDQQAGQHILPRLTRSMAEGLKAAELYMSGGFLK